MKAGCCYLLKDWACLGEKQFAAYYAIPYQFCGGCLYFKRRQSKDQC